MDEDGQESEFAEFTVEDLIAQGILLKAQLKGRGNKDGPDPDAGRGDQPS